MSDIAQTQGLEKVRLDIDHVEDLLNRLTFFFHIKNKKKEKRRKIQ